LKSILRRKDEREKMGTHHQHGNDHHGHHHHHHHAHGQSLERIGQAFWLNVIFTVIELIGGAMTNSVAILADAVHDLGDSLALAFAWYMEKQSRSEFDRDSFTYGMRRLSVLSAIVTGLVLVFGSFFSFDQICTSSFASRASKYAGDDWLGLVGSCCQWNCSFACAKRNIFE
jgi:cobalt-zinc-cadmium efflux system protein